MCCCSCTRARLSQLHSTSMHVCYGAEPAGIYTFSSDPQYVPVLVPYQHACKHNCTRPSGMYMYVAVAPGQQPCHYSYKSHTISANVCYSFILSASIGYYICTKPSAISVTIASDHLPCILQWHKTSSHICKTYAYKHACLRHLHQSSIHICYSNIKHLCCLLHLHQTSLLVMVVAIAPDQQICILVTPNHAAVKIVTKICSMQMSYSGVVSFFLIHCTP